ncbi:MAG: 16S rRNA methyltransferase [Euryarchaeota archaeon]|nr:16S rRNA methyltransferase [Euryarchaeota archaeon]
MLTLVLADSELETVPGEIAGHPCCVTYARRRGRAPRDTLLDSTVHHPALKRLSDGQRRGRPDLVHFFLLTALDSLLNLEGGLRVAVHTRNGRIIRVRPDTRLPKNQSRFVSLMEQLFQKGQVPPAGEPLMTMSEGTVGDLLRDLGASKVVVFSPRGDRVDLRRRFSRVRGRDIACVVGGFPDGDFTSPVYGLADEVLSISGSELKVWTVAAEILVNFRK